MKNEPVAWVYLEKWMAGIAYPDECFSDEELKGTLPLYTHPAKTSDWNCDDVNIDNLEKDIKQFCKDNFRLAPFFVMLYHALNIHPADLTDKEINPAPTLEEIIKWQEERITKLEKENEELNHLCFEFGILRKASEK